MAGITAIGSTTIGLASLPNSITARGNGVYDIVSNSTPYINITVGFVYSTSNMVVSANSPSGGLDTGSLINGIGISEISTPNLYPGGPSVYPFTSTDINVDYTLSIAGILPNTNYNVRSYIKYYGPAGEGPFYKYGSQLSILSSSGVSGGSGYYISNDTVGFYDPLQVREANEGIERVLTSDSSGLATWKPVKSLFTFGHYIGERYGGGIVAAVWKEGDDEKVLIVSDSDVLADTPTGPSYIPTWSYGVSRTELIGAGAQSRYNGYLNTAAIVAQSISLGTTYSAAAGAAAYRGGGFEDWYLPSYYEFNQVFNNVAIVNKVLEKETIDLTKTGYWTSTEYNSNQAVQFSGWGGLASSTYALAFKNSQARIRAVRKESVYTGDGLIFNLDATNKKSFSDIDYMNLGTASRWKDLVNGGIGLSYSFLPSYYPSASSGGTTAPLLTYLDTIGGTENLGYRQVGSWWIDKMSGFSTPILYNRTGESSMTSVYFSVPLNGNANLQFECFDNSVIKDTVTAKLSIYVSIDSGAYMLFKELDDITTASTRKISLNAFLGKTISIKIKAPNAYYVSTTDYGGTAVDNISVSSTSGGYQATGPVYLPQESGFFRFNGTGSLANEFSSYGSYFDIVAPVGSATTMTVEIWMRLKDGYQTRMPFAWSKYSIFTGDGGGLGFNTGASDLFGINSAKVQSLGIVGKWAHFVFEMRSNVSYTNNKMYINGNEQVLSQVTGAENAAERNFNGGVGRVGGWRSPDNNKLYLFQGDISVVRIYNRPLTKDEIMKNYSTEKKRYEILPTILENNIFASIDFDNTASYSGDGSVTGTVNDLSRNVRNATLTISGTTTKPSVVRTNSLYNGRELVFPGTIEANPYLSWADSVAFQELVNLSVSFWVKFSVHRTSEIIVRWNSAASAIGPWEVFQLSSATSTVIAVRLKSSTTTFEVSGTKTIPLNKWTHVCATYDNTTKKVRTYIDSAIDIDTAVPTTFSIATGIAGPVSVGRYVNAINNLSYPLQGSIASIQIYNKALTAGEIKNNYDADKHRFDNFTDANKFYSHEINGNPTFSISQNFRLNIGDSFNEKIMKLDSFGYSKWIDKSSLFTRPTNYRYIGELYGGGIIVAMWYYPKTIFNYLIMSLEDVSAGSQWSNITNVVSGATSEHRGDTNQTAILAQGGHTTSAAKICDDYTGGGYTDWYLPSVFEMNQAFNAAGIVDTVLGSDKLDGTYWTSTEPYQNGSDGAMSYSFLEAGTSTGIQQRAGKASTYKVRAFRMATNAVVTNVWNPSWDETYTPWWGRGIDHEFYWERDFMPASYTPFDFDYWRRTTISTGILTFFSQSGAAPNYTLTFKVTGSSVTSYENISEFGVCWTGASSQNSPVFYAPTPTVNDNKVVSNSRSYSSFSSTIVWTGVEGTYSNLYGNLYTINVRAYAITTSGNVYYGDLKYYPTQINMV